MGFRFQKRIKFGKFFTVNLSKSGVSGSVGVKGARVTVGHGKVTKTVGLPGTGLSYRTSKRLGQKQKTVSKKEAISEKEAIPEKGKRVLTPREIRAIRWYLAIVATLVFFAIFCYIVAK
jgi:hypothetical protein